MVQVGTQGHEVEVTEEQSNSAESMALCRYEGVRWHHAGKWQVDITMAGGK